MKIDLKQFYKIALLVTVSGVVTLVADFGFPQTEKSQNFLNSYYFVILIFGILSSFLRHIKEGKIVKRKAFIFDSLSILFTLVILFQHFITGDNNQQSILFYNDSWVKLAVAFSFIREFSEIKLNFKRTVLNPAQLFISSFLLIIFFGTFLLMLPKATYSGISFLDSLFTATSAVCVTGLIVVDTGSYFTLFGQTIILLLIQIGGLGILTFASYFSYFFKGGTSYENQIVIGDMTSSKKLSDVFLTLKYILLITFSIEFFSAIMIYLSLPFENFQSQFDRLFFAGFHAISAFCNAGFSTLPNSLYQSSFRFNYLLQIIIIITFALGGLGFAIVVNSLNYLKYKIATLFSLTSKKYHFKPWVLNLNSRITLITTLSLSAFGLVVFYILEYNNTLAEHDGLGKVIVALFGATTPRTAGFNSIDTAALTFPTLMVVLLLMWIGASPSSTGGGIKTSTFAIAILNVLSLAKGKSRIEVFRREISDISIRRSFAIISLSLITIGFGIIFISFFDSDKNLMSIAFECFSAYSTVGLSLGITNQLSNASKFVLIAIMFIGRVSMLSIVIAVFKKVKYHNYHYPTEEITIN